MNASIRNQLAVNYASIELRQFLHRKFRRLDGTRTEAILGPVIDEADYYRLGNDTINLGELHYDSEAFINTQRDRQLARGFPRIIPSEFKHVTDIFYHQIRATLPDRRFVALHFPGGDIHLTATHVKPMHYNNPQDIQRWVNLFRSKTDAWGMMLSHATYDLGAFTDMDKVTPPNIPSFVEHALRRAAGVSEQASAMELYSRVPASLNPYVMNYLRENLGYKGTTVSDWYNMEGILAFARRMDFEPLVSKAYQSLPRENQEGVRRLFAPDDYDKVFIAAVAAGVEVFRPSTIISNLVRNDFWKVFEEHSPKEYAEFQGRLNELIARKYLRMTGQPDATPQAVAELAQNISKLPFAHKVNLVAEPANPFAPRESQYFPELSTENRALYDRLHHTINVDNEVTGNDIWRRKGVATMQFRVAMVRYQAFLDGKGSLAQLEQKWPSAPVETGQEEQWITRLMEDKEFKTRYDRIGGRDGKGWEKLYDTVDLERASSPDITVLRDSEASLARGQAGTTPSSMEPTSSTVGGKKRQARPPR